jgi:hypothetical protein
MSALCHLALSQSYRSPCFQACLSLPRYRHFRGPQRVSDIEEQAAKAHLDVQVLEEARRDLGLVTSRANTGGAQAVQWSLPG